MANAILMRVKNAITAMTATTSPAVRQIQIVVSRTVTRWRTAIACRNIPIAATVNAIRRLRSSPIANACRIAAAVFRVKPPVTRLAVSAQTAFRAVPLAPTEIAQPPANIQNALELATVAFPMKK